MIEQPKSRQSETHNNNNNKTRSNENMKNNISQVNYVYSRDDLMNNLF